MSVGAQTAFQQEFSVPALPSDHKGVWGEECEVRWEDGRQSLQVLPLNADEDNGMFVRLQSWSEGAPHEVPLANHLELAALLGKRVRVTVEILP